MGETMALSAEDIIRGGTLPTTSVPVCMHAGLTAEHERLDTQLQEAIDTPRDSLAAGSNVAELSERLREIEEEMRAHTVTFELRALPRPAWRALVASHPPRQKDDGSVDERDVLLGMNTETFFEAMIRACTSEPELSDEVWRLLFDEKLTDRKFDDLSRAAWGLNRRDVDVPFSAAALQIRNSGPELRRPNGSASA